MKYELCAAAYEDFLHLYAQGISRFGFRQAEIYVDGLERAFELIAQNPKLARLRSETSPPVRIHPHGSHLVIYRETGDGALILRIRHARENWMEHPL